MTIGKFVFAMVIAWLIVAYIWLGVLAFNGTVYSFALICCSLAFLWSLANSKADDIKMTGCFIGLVLTCFAAAVTFCLGDCLYRNVGNIFNVVVSLVFSVAGSWTLASLLVYWWQAMNKKETSETPTEAEQQPPEKPDATKDQQAG